MTGPTLNPSSSGLTRRRVVAAGGLGAAGLLLPGPLLNRGAVARAKRRPFAREGNFAHGVACGFPEPDGGVLWTRVSELDRTSRIGYEIATDEGFGRIVKRGDALARRKKDFTVHAEVGGLKPATQYWYRFFTRDGSSRVGRMRTAPPRDSLQPIRIGFFSCQSYEAGYFNAHAGLAQEEDVDLVLCLGDYIYEQGFFHGPEDRVDTTGDNGDGDVQLLKEYREKYRLYQSDPDLQDMLAAHPFVAVWDDHEVEENHAGDSPSPKGDRQTESGGGNPRRTSYGRRRRNAYHAFFEAMPRKRRSGDPRRIYGRVKLGGMVDLFNLDSRQYRDVQPCGDQIVVPCPEEDDPGRKLLGDRQKQWLKDSLEGSPARWRLLGNSIMLMGFESAPTVTFNVDQWDGYGAEREELMQHLLDRDIDNVVSLVGDIHTFFAGQVTTTGSGFNGTPAATELVGGSITSPGVAEIANLPPEQFDLIASNATVNNPHLTYAEFEHKGYGLMTASLDELTCDFRAVETISERGAEPFTLASFRIPNGRPEVEQTA